MYFFQSEKTEVYDMVETKIRKYALFQHHRKLENEVIFGWILAIGLCGNHVSDIIFQNNLEHISFYRSVLMPLLKEIWNRTYILG